MALCELRHRDAFNILIPASFLSIRLCLFAPSGDSYMWPLEMSLMQAVMEQLCVAQDGEPLLAPHSAHWSRVLQGCRDSSGTQPVPGPSHSSSQPSCICLHCAGRAGSCDRGVLCFHDTIPPGMSLPTPHFPLGAATITSLQQITSTWRRSLHREGGRCM